MSRVLVSVLRGGIQPPRSEVADIVSHSAHGSQPPGLDFIGLFGQTPDTINESGHSATQTRRTATDAQGSQRGTSMHRDSETRTEALFRCRGGHGRFHIATAGRRSAHSLELSTSIPEFHFHTPLRGVCEMEFKNCPINSGSTPLAGPAKLWYHSLVFRHRKRNTDADKRKHAGSTTFDFPSHGGLRPARMFRPPCDGFSNGGETP